MTETQEEPVDILRRIVRTKEDELRDLRPRRAELEARAGDREAPRDFRAALARAGHVSLIAEVKRRSPGAGEIRPGLDPVGLARRYAAAPAPGGASAISVLTDGPWFGGSLEDLDAVKGAVEVPVLRKDFTLDPLQVTEARAAGADCVLLIVRILDDARLRELADAVRVAGMAALVEVHDGPELDRALAAGADIIGINNRDLDSFTTDLRTTLSLADRVPDGTVLVSESGIRTPDDVARLAGAGVDAILVGESLLRADDPGAHARALAGVERAGRPTEPAGP